VSNPPGPRRIEIKDDDDQTVAAADVTAQPGRDAARASLHPGSGHVPPGSRARLVDAVVDTPEVRESGRLEAAVPLGDAEALERIRERADEVETRPAGATALLDASIQPPPEPEPGPGEPGPGEPAPS
jgi:hypothetical protein